MDTLKDRIYQICKRCVMDTTDKDIIFDENGYCNHCTNAIKLLKQPPYGLPSTEKEKVLNELIQKIKQSGKDKQYDCVIGLSGGIDSSYLAYLIKQWGLRPIAVHLDNHWNSTIADQNINNIYKILNFCEKRIVSNWDDFKNLQLAFLKSSTSHSEMPTDNLISEALWYTAKKNKIKYILAGTNLSTESILPRSWSKDFLDEVYIKSVYKEHGNKKKLPFKILSNWDIIKYKRIYKINLVNILDYISYDKEYAKKIIKKELNWKEYGRKHGESTYTRIFQEYILPEKFNIDKRRAHLSSLIVCGQISREEAINNLKLPLYTDDEAKKNDIYILCKKFEISIDDFKKIMDLPVKTGNEYFDESTSFKYKIIKLAKLIFSLRKK